MLPAHSCKNARSSKSLSEVNLSPQSQSRASEFVRVGKVKDAHGIKGELFIVLFAGEAAWLNKLKSLRLIVPEDALAQADSSPKEFKIKSARAHKNGLI